MSFHYQVVANELPRPKVGLESERREWLSNITELWRMRKQYQHRNFRPEEPLWPSGQEPDCRIFWDKYKSDRRQEERRLEKERRAQLGESSVLEHSFTRKGSYKPAIATDKLYISRHRGDENTKKRARLAHSWTTCTLPSCKCASRRPGGS